MLAPQLLQPIWQSHSWAAREWAAELAGCMFPEDLSNKVVWNHFNGKLCPKIPTCGEQRPSQQNVIFAENIFPNAKSIILALFRIKHFNMLLKNGSLHNIKWKRARCQKSEQSVLVQNVSFRKILMKQKWVFFYHAGTRYFSCCICCILKEECPSKWGFQVLYCSKYQFSPSFESDILQWHRPKEIFSQGVTKSDGKSSLFLSRKKTNKKKKPNHHQKKIYLLLNSRKEKKFYFILGVKKLKLAPKWPLRDTNHNTVCQVCGETDWTVCQFRIYTTALFLQWRISVREYDDQLKYFELGGQGLLWTHVPARFLELAQIILESWLKTMKLGGPSP